MDQTALILLLGLVVLLVPSFQLVLVAQLVLLNKKQFHKGLLNAKINKRIKLFYSVTINRCM